MFSGWTYGAEHELADIPRLEPLPVGFGWDDRDVTIVNSNGIANDPKGLLYGFGGEINTPPTDTVAEQVSILPQIKRLFPQAAVNYRSNLHVHVRVPGLRENLRLLKQAQVYIHKWVPLALQFIEPLPRPVSGDYPTQVELAGAIRRWRRRRVSHQTLLSAKRLSCQLSAATVDQFFDWEPPSSSSGKPLWHAQPRVCVSLRQLLQTDTVEFRHFPGTLVEEELQNCVEWCRRFLALALEDQDPSALFAWAERKTWPRFPAYVHWQEVRYRATVHDGTLTKAQIKANIAAILAGDFDEHFGGVSR